MEWLNSLEPVLKIYWIIAGTASLIFVIQMIMTFIGMDSHDGLNADFDGDTSMDGPFQFFSLRNLVNFFLGFGWGGVCFYNTFEAKIWVSLCAVITGILFVLLFFLLIKALLKLNKDNTFCIENTLNQTADVYLTIPAEKSGKGIIQISVKGSVHEIAALTKQERIATGAKVRVVEIIDNQTVLVTKI
ncbi:MAG: serine protease [Bacteroidales bacterium]|jgi:membrane protein implicated in regulation of membrane protease activity|nr:serine protease [Bacteroidales bacterium]